MSESLLDKVVGIQACNFIQKRLQHRCFSVNIVKFLRTFILKNICARPLLKIPERPYSKRVLLYLLNGKALTSGIVTLASWFSGHRFKLEAGDLIFHLPQRSFPNFGLKILVLCLARSLRRFYFSFFLFLAGILAQRLVKTFP